MNIKIVQMNIKIVQMDIKIVQMELFCVMRLSNKFCHELIYGNLKKKI